MRDINRIYAFTRLFCELWLKMPDMRFFQMIDYIKSKLPEDAVGVLTVPIHEEEVLGPLYMETILRDPFYTEDDITIQTMRSILDELS